MIVLSHPTGNQNLRAVLEGLANHQLLHQFNTSVAVFDRSGLDRLARIKPFAEFRKRKFDAAVKNRTYSYPFREMGRLVTPRIGLPMLSAHEEAFFSIDQVYRTLDRRVSKKLLKNRDASIKAVYAYEDGAVQSFRAAKNKGLQCFYDLPIGYWRTARKLLSEEREKQRDWAVTLTGFRDSEAKLKQKDEELELADHIFVASRFTARSLEDYPGPLGPVHVIPYGFPPVVAQREYGFAAGRRLKLLFVGGLSQRKGLSYLFEAVDKLGAQVELTVVGRKIGGDCPALEQALAKHRWIPSLPHAKVLELMQAQDLMIFPSLFEGFGLVITEAMSQGTPVITTERTAGPDLITDGEDGWIIPAGSAQALAEKLEEVLEQPRKLREAGKTAMETARKRPWNAYGTELARSLQEIIV